MPRFAAPRGGRESRADRESPEEDREVCAGRSLNGGRLLVGRAALAAAVTDREPGRLAGLVLEVLAPASHVERALHEQCPDAGQEDRAQV